MYEVESQFLIISIYKVVQYWGTFPGLSLTFLPFPPNWDSPNVLPYNFSEYAQLIFISPLGIKFRRRPLFVSHRRICRCGLSFLSPLFPFFAKYFSFIEPLILHYSKSFTFSIEEEAAKIRGLQSTYCTTVFFIPRSRYFMVFVRIKCSHLWRRN